MSLHLDQQKLTNAVECFELGNTSHTKRKHLVHAFVTSRIDTNNSLLFIILKDQLHSLQRLQNIATHVITYTKPSDHISPKMEDLHWPPVDQCIKFNPLDTLFINQSHSCFPTGATDHTSDNVQSVITDYSATDPSYQGGTHQAGER